MLNYKRNMQRALESIEAHPAGTSQLASVVRWLLIRRLLRKPQERATFFFALSTLAPSTKHRLYVATYAGVGLALAAFGIMEVLVNKTHWEITPLLLQPNEALLNVPLILSFCLLSGIRLVFTLPAELPSNWVFQIAEDKDWRDGCAGTRKAMTAFAMVLLVAVFPVYSVLWGWPAAFQQLVFGVVLSLILIELLLLNFRKIPFTCSYQAGKANITVLGVFYWLGFTTYAYTMAALERWLLYDDARWAGFLVLMLVVLGGMIEWRKTLPTGGSGIVYEDVPNPNIQTLGLST